MTTNTYTSILSHTTDAEFRAWGSALASAMQTCGLIKTADTGQINWATALRPTVSGTMAGYEIYRFNDTLQSTAPVFIKLEYGSASNTNIPGLIITVGTGSNGAGTLTGFLTTRQIAQGQTTVLSNTTTAVPTYVCYKNGFLGVVFKVGSQNAPTCCFMFMVGRTCDDTGAETGDGVYVFRRSSGNAAAHQLETMRFSDGAKSPSSVGTEWSMVPGTLTSSLVNGVGTAAQAFKCYLTLPTLVRPMLHVATVLKAEYPVNNTFSVAMVGATPRTYISTGDGLSYGSITANSAHTTAMLWE